MPRDEVLSAEQRLIDTWIRPALGADAAIRVGEVGEEPERDGIEASLTLLDLVPAPAARRGTLPAPLQLRARYLVSVRGGAAERHQALAELGFHAPGIPDLELEATPPGPALWSALGVSARPALIASVRLTRERPRRIVPRVRQPLETRWLANRPLAGRVVGPGDLPIAGALVEVEGAPLSAYSNHRGEFAFGAVPGGDAPPLLVISAKGTQLTVRVDPDHGPDRPVLIRVPISES